MSSTVVVMARSATVTIRPNRRLRFDEIAGKAVHPTSKAYNEIVAEALEELATSIEELQIADEELRQQNDELLETRQELEEQRQRYQELFELAPDGYLVMDAGGVIREANQATTALLGVRGGFLAGKPLALYVSPKGRQAFRTHLASAVRHKNAVTLSWETELKPRSGSPFPAAITVTVHRNSRGKTPLVRCMIRDISRQHAARKKMTAMNRKLEARVISRSAKLTQANEDLRGEAAERKRLAVEVLRASEVERQRVGQDLHDSLGQKLTGLAFLSSNLQRGLADAHLPGAVQAAFITNRLNETVAATRILARGLCPVVLRPEELCTALTQLAADIQALFHIRCQVRCSPSLSIGSGIVAVHLYRIAQEAVSNAARHGKAKRIVIRLTPQKKGLRLVVEDNGIGLPPGRRNAAGMGLHIMAYRAEALGGRFEIRPRRGGGTQIVCLVPSDGRPS